MAEVSAMARVAQSGHVPMRRLQQVHSKQHSAVLCTLHSPLFEARKPRRPG
jgi:hypothetical protein